MSLLVRLKANTLFPLDASFFILQAYYLCGKSVLVFKNARELSVYVRPLVMADVLLSVLSCHWTR
jgi:hypothetical protein